MHRHQQMIWVNSALRVCSSFGPLPPCEHKDLAHAYREAAAGDKTHAAYDRATRSRAIRRSYPEAAAAALRIIAKEITRENKSKSSQVKFILPMSKEASPESVWVRFGMTCSQEHFWLD